MDGDSEPATLLVAHVAERAPRLEDGDDAGEHDLPLVLREDQDVVHLQREPLGRGEVRLEPEVGLGHVELALGGGRHGVELVERVELLGRPQLEAAGAALELLHEYLELLALTLVEHVLEPAQDLVLDQVVVPVLSVRARGEVVEEVRHALLEHGRHLVDLVRPELDLLLQDLDHSLRELRRDGGLPLLGVVLGTNRPEEDQQREDDDPCEATHAPPPEAANLSRARAARKGPGVSPWEVEPLGRDACPLGRDACPLGRDACPPGRDECLPGRDECLTG